MPITSSDLNKMEATVSPADESECSVLRAAMLWTALWTDVQDDSAPQVADEFIRARRASVHLRALMTQISRERD